MNEFGLIRHYFAPLAQQFPGSLNLMDDAAVIDPPAGQELIITKDAISEGIHFTGEESPDFIARKLLRVNLSDLAAMGADPLAYFLAVMLPKGTDEEWIRLFANGLAADQQTFGIHLAGGDTTATKGGLSLSLTALGTVPKGAALTRSGAREGDLVCVSGTLGDGALGLKVLQETLTGLAETDSAFLQQRYLLPEPRLALGKQLRGIASACMDISDGLVQDLGHICEASGCSAVIDAQTLPLSQAVRHAIALSPEMSMEVLTGGDDYELLFTVPADNVAKLPKDCTIIGTIQPGSGISVLDDTGKPMQLEHTGYRHF